MHKLLRVQPIFVLKKSLQINSLLDFPGYYICKDKDGFLFHYEIHFTVMKTPTSLYLKTGTMG